MRISVLVLFFPLTLFATEEMPWFAQPFEVQFRADARYQHFSQIQRPGTNRTYHSDDLFIHLSGEVSPWQDIDAEIELSLAHTAKRQFGADGFRITGRYLLLDDIIGDPFSVAVGGTLIKAWKHAVHDPSVFYNSRLEGEVHLAIGREFPRAPYWSSRIWSFLALGISDSGSPWFRANFAWEKNFCDRHQVRLFTDSLWGGGGDAFPDSISRFKGYGDMRYQAVDVGIRYFYLIPYFGNVNASYSFRTYSLNAPAYTHNFVVQVVYVLGL